MHTTSTLITLFYLTTLLPTIVLSLGINCRGSGMCPLASWENKARERITQVLRDAVWDSPKPNSTTYANGDHVICVSQFQTISISKGQTSGADVAGATDEQSTTLGLSGVIGGGGICLFPQHLSAGTLSLGEIRQLTDAILEHGCGTCGSVPVHFVDEGSNDPKDGILTFNYAKNPDCVGNCLSATGQPWINGTVYGSGTQYSRRMKRTARIEEVKVGEE